MPLVGSGDGPRGIVGSGDIGLDHHEAVSLVLDLFDVLAAEGLPDEHERVARECTVTGGLREAVRSL
jgi:hypothetical protein